MSLNNRINIYLNDDEFLYITENAKKMYMRNSSFIKHIIFNSLDKEIKLNYKKDMKKIRKKIVSIAFNKEELDKLTDCAKKYGITRNNLIREIIFKDRN